MREGGGARISRLPKPLQRPALRLRDALPAALTRRLPVTYVYRSDGLATAHRSPFLDEPEFNRLFWNIAHRWAGGPVDLRWRVWLLSQCARQCTVLDGGFVEFGVYRAASAYMILAWVGLPAGTTFHLFDTFTGIPPTGLTDPEVEAGFEGGHADTTVSEVEDFLAAWRDQTILVVGDVFDTVVEVETGPLAFVHLDLNAAGPTRAALDYAYRRLVPHGIIVFDDYGWTGYDDQRRVIDHYFVGRSEAILALPTGQAIVVKH